MHNLSMVGLVDSGDKMRAAFIRFDELNVKLEHFENI